MGSAIQLFGPQEPGLISTGPNQPTGEGQPGDFWRMLTGGNPPNPGTNRPVTLFGVPINQPAPDNPAVGLLRELFDLGPFNPNLERLEPSKPKVQWPQNTHVLTATVQEGKAYFKDGYIQTLIKNLDKYDSIAEAHRQVKTGYKKEIPQEMVKEAKAPDAWRRDDKTTPRRVLIIAGDGTNDEQKKIIKQDVENLRNKLISEYNVKPEDIVILSETDPKKIEEEMKKMKEFSDRNPNAEALVVYSGHGGICGDEPGLGREDAAKQGGRVGVLDLDYVEGSDGKKGETVKMTDTEFKTLTNKYLTGYKNVLIVIDACHSGAFIARADNPGQGQLAVA